MFLYSRLKWSCFKRFLSLNYLPWVISKIPILFGSTYSFVIRCCLFMDTMVTNDDLISYFSIFSETRFQRTSPMCALRTPLKNQLIQKIRCGCKWLPFEFEISLRPSSMICCSFCSYDDLSKNLDQKDFRFQNCTENVLEKIVWYDSYKVQSWTFTWLLKNLTDFTIECRGLNY